MSLQQLVRAFSAVDTLRPGDDGYDAAARVFFARGTPALVARPRDPEQVAAALTHAARHDLSVSVRSGGHSPLGHSTNDGGMVLDLAHLDHVEVLDATRRLVRVGGGATWGKVGAALGPLGWALTAGDTRDVGVGGLTLGGGVGWLVRRYGLAIDNLVGARVVTAGGLLLTASADEHPELFWALRGGGGNFGVVVDLDFVAQPVATVDFGVITYQLGDAGELLRRWRDAMRRAPDELSSTLMLMPGAPSAMLQLCYAGSAGVTETDADAVIEPLLGLGTVLEARIGERRYSDILEHAAHPPGMRMGVRNTLVPSLDEGTVAAIARLHAAAGPTAIAIRSLGGAFGRVPADATAFAHRDAEAMIVLAVLQPETAGDADLDRALRPWAAVAACGTGAYVNFQGSASDADLAAAYPPATYARLAAVKRAYDPGNLFARNHNVRPAAADVPQRSTGSRVAQFV